MWAFFPKKSSMRKSARCLDCRSQLRDGAIAGLRFPFEHGVVFIESPSNKRNARRAMSLIDPVRLSLRAESFALGKKDVLPGAGLGYRCTRVYRTRDLRSVRYGTEPHRHH